MITPKQNQYLAEAAATLAKAQEAAAAAQEAATEAHGAATHIARRLPLPSPVKIVTGAPPSRGVARKFSLERQRQYLDAIARGTGRSDAAKLVGVTRQTVKNLRDQDPDFAAAEDEAEQLCCDLVEESLFESARSGNIEAIKVWLFNRAPGRWQPIQKLQVQVSGQVDHVVDLPTALAEIEQLEAVLRGRVLRSAETPELGPGVVDAEEIEDED